MVLTQVCEQAQRPPMAEGEMGKEWKFLGSKKEQALSYKITRTVLETCSLEDVSRRGPVWCREARGQPSQASMQKSGGSLGQGCWKAAYGNFLGWQEGPILVLSGSREIVETLWTDLLRSVPFAGVKSYPQTRKLSK